MKLRLMTLDVRDEGEEGRASPVLQRPKPPEYGDARRLERKSIYQRRPPPPPPPPLPLGRASLTFSVRPPSSVPLTPRIAAWAAEASDISTKAKPRGRPVSRSVMTLTLSTSP